MQKKHYGFLYIAISAIIDWLKYLNLVEFFKATSQRFNKNKQDPGAVSLYGRVGADIFIVVKWAFLIILWHWQVSNMIAVSILWYLVITNVFTYFFYHIWSVDAITAGGHPIDRVKRRFLNLVLAAAFSTLSFAFFYSVPYRTQFDWPFSEVNKLHSILFSFSNSLAANYDGVKPKTDFSNLLSNLQLFISFIFFTVILSSSIPKTTSTT